MTQSHSVACPSCGATLKISKASLIGKRVPCPSCKAPFLIEGPKEEYIPLADDPPLVRSFVAVPASVPAKSSGAKSGSTKSSGTKAARPDSADIPLLADEPIRNRRGEPSNVGQSSASNKKRTDSKSDTSIRESGKDSKSGGSRSDSKTFVSKAESNEIRHKALADSSGTDLFDEEAPKPRPARRQSKKTEADVETSEFDSMLTDTEVEDREVGDNVSLARGNKSRTKIRTNAGADEREALPAVPADIEDEEEDPNLGLPPLPPRVRTRGGLAAAERGPIVVWTCVGAGVLVLLLVYVLFSSRPTSVPTVTPTQAAAPDTEEKSSEVAETDKTAADKSAPDKSDAPEGAVEARSLLGRKGKEIAKKPLKGKNPATGLSPSGASSEDADATEQKSSDQTATKPAQAKPDEEANTSPGTNGDKKANTAAKEPIDPKTAVAASGAGHATKPPGGGIGRTIPPFSAAAVDNTTFHFADRKEQVLVVAFLGVECPLANLYAPSLAGLAKHYRGKSVGIIAVNSNAQDTLEQTRAQARVNGLTFPVLKDAGNAVADLFGAERTPEVFVLDAQRTVCYHGMLDDQYGYRERRSTPTKTYAIDAVDALLKSGSVAVAETPVQGCHIGRVTKPSETAKTSYYHDVLPILQNRCQQCHRKGEIGPFALSDYEVVRDWGPTIRDAVVERRMPPWPADQKIGKFANDCSLPEQEINAITQWVDEGCPQGDPAEKPPAKEFANGWNIGKPDSIYSMHESFHVPATGVIDYKGFAISPVFAKDTWVRTVECRFGNRGVVHHMLVLLDFPKDKSRSQDGLVKGFFAAGVPGATHCVFPDGYAKKIPKGARLRVQMHYTPNGTPGDDQSKVGVVLAKGNSFREIQTFALGRPDILIPAGEADHVESSEQAFPMDVTLTTLMPHLHVRGKSFEFFLQGVDGKREPLLSVPKWDFNWQYQYELATPLTVPKGSKLVVEAHWDNSLNNPNNFLPLVDARFGEQTFDEMFIGYINVIPAKTTADAGPAPRPRTGGRRG